jgi:hypothetical protein
MNEQARQINADVLRDNGMAEEDEPPAVEPPKCEECAHYFTMVYPPFCTETRDSLRYARSTDGTCGPEGRLFVRKGGG